MSIRFDAVGDYLQQTANLPSTSLYTIMGWFRLLVDRNDFSTMFCIGDTTTTVWDYRGVQTDTDGTTLINAAQMDTGAHFTVTSYAMVVNRWTHICQVYDSTSCRLYVDGVLINTHATVSLAPNNQMTFGNDPDSEWLNGNIAGIKVWGATLSQSEIWREISQLEPVRPGGTYFPLYTTSDYKNYSPTKTVSALTPGGTLTSDQHPIVRRFFQNPRRTYAKMVAANTNLTNLNSVWKWKNRRSGMLPTSTFFSSDSDQAETTLVLSLLFPAASTTTTLTARKLLLGVGR